MIASKILRNRRQRTVIGSILAFGCMMAVAVPLAFAWIFTTSAKTICLPANNGGETAWIQTDFYNGESKPVKVVVTTPFGTVDEIVAAKSKAKNLLVDTGLQSVPDGKVEGKIYWTDGKSGVHTFTRYYDGITCKAPPEPEVPTTPQPEEPVIEVPETIEIVTPVPTPVIKTPTSTSIRIAKIGPSRARVLVNVRYVIRVRNAGRYTAKNVVMRDLIPSGMSFVRSTTKHSFKNGSVVFKLGNIKPNRAKSVTLWLKASANVRGKRTNRAIASASNAKTVRAQRTTTFWRPPVVKPPPAVTG